jgi:hypothetical protein
VSIYSTKTRTSTYIFECRELEMLLEELETVTDGSIIAANGLVGSQGSVGTVTAHAYDKTFNSLVEDLIVSDLKLHDELLIYSN